MMAGNWMRLFAETFAPMQHEKTAAAEAPALS